MSHSITVLDERLRRLVKGNTSFILHGSIVAFPAVPCAQSRSEAALVQTYRIFQSVLNVKDSFSIPALF